MRSPQTPETRAPETRGEEAAPQLSVSPDTVCYVIAKAREFDVKTASSDPSASATDDDDIAVAALEDRPSDPVEEELAATISALSDDGQIDLVALMWLGRDDGTLDDWEETRRIAADEHNEATAVYLCGTPLLADYLAAGLALFGHDCSDFLRGHA